ncbi:MAG: methyltransferase domain-containing protein [Betaproteobacteria bacterium]|nr:methyltransferase domain-containing protein [Betaproteobacteria bacterium]
MSGDNAGMSWEDAVRWLREQPGKAQLVADCYYDDPLLSAAQRYWSSAEWQAVRVLLRGRSGAALDVGAGRGIASYALARDGFAVTALEPNPSSLVGAEAIRGLAAESGLTIRVAENFSERLPFVDNHFDVVFARAVLHHTSNLTAACREFLRVLKPGGIMVAVREHVISAKADLPAFFDIHPLHHQYGGENAFLLSEYTQAIRRAGFVAMRVISPWHSPINFAPYDLAGVQRAIASRCGFLEGPVDQLLKVPGVWPLARALLTVSDRRPGRLYSFTGFKASS